MTERINFPEIGWREPTRFAKLLRHEIIRNTPSIRPASSDIAARVAAIDWTQAAGDLDAQGCTVLKGLLSPEECHALAGTLSRRQPVPQPRGDGTPRLRPRRVQVFFLSAARSDRGIAARCCMRGSLSVANRWNEAMGIDIRYPDGTRRS